MLQHVEVSEQTQRFIRILSAYLVRFGYVFSISAKEVVHLREIAWDGSDNITTFTELTRLKTVVETFILNFDKLSEDKLPADKKEARANYARALTLQADLKHLVDLVYGEEDRGGESHT